MAQRGLPSTPKEMMTEEMRHFALLAVIQNDEEMPVEKLSDEPLSHVCLRAAIAHGYSKGSYTKSYIPQEYLNPRFFIDVIDGGGSIELSAIPGKIKTEKLCLKAVTQNGKNIRGVPHKKISRKICLAAVQNAEGALEYVPEELKAPELCLLAVQGNGRCLEYVPKKLRTMEICSAAYKEHPEAEEYIPKILARKIISAAK